MGSAGSMLSRPPDMRPVIRHRLSQDSLHQLEKNASANESLTSSRDSRIQHWVHGLAHGTTVVGNSLLDFGLYHDLSQNSFDITASYTAGFGQPPPNHRSTITRDFPGQVNNNTGHTFRPEFISHPPAPRQQVRSVCRSDLPGNNRLPSKAMSMAQKSSYDGTLNGDGSTSQPPTKKVFTGKHLRAASAFVDLSSMVPVVEPVAAKPSIQNASSTSAATVDAKSKSQKEKHQEEFGEKIQAVFPDICDEYVKKLYAKYKPFFGNVKDATRIIELALEDILEQPSYPKKIQKKRKQMADSVNDNDVKEVRSDPIYYFPIVVKLLEKQFTSLPKKTIKHMVVQYKTLFKAYIALCHLGQPSSDASDYWARLYQVKDQHPPRLADVLEHEMQAAKKVVAEKEDAERKETEGRQEKINEEEHRLAGALVECQCCFSEVPQNRIIPCEGEEVHWFCNSCLKTQAETQIGLMQYELKCFDMSGCPAAFNIKNVRIVLGDKLMKRLEDLQQMDEVAKASIDGLEECPFCEFKAICPPVEQDKEFNCQNPECERTSCRLCKEDSHIPLSCKEAKADRATHTRHTVEEAMTNALIRKCPKCKVSIIKEDGCNKLKCGRCGTLICDVCKQDISNKGYEHFSRNVCPLHEVDKGANRRMKEVTQAEMEAVNSIVNKSRDIDPALLRVSKQVLQTKQHAPAVTVSLLMPPTLRMPAIPKVSAVPRLPAVPAVPKLAATPKVPTVPNLPAMPQMSPLPKWPTIPKMPSLSIHTTFPNTNTPYPPQQPIYRTTTIPSTQNPKQHTNMHTHTHTHPHSHSHTHIYPQQQQQYHQHPLHTTPRHGHLQAHRQEQQQQQQNRPSYNVSNNPNQIHRQI
ncbi:hypothetical protein UA08_00245 [Talaromyces atroroseus]|uniref:RING-type domain-containing protein n=1 Tax=Talaromyces atroroseus TaxID=1441469 RepID=A0A225AZZ2_TALAT|nr:hypothetical protein UA08_00245 [Talaromyces atroroseus]OKL64024.1 hypothetical protein UA08_00245 [Talaromyces atroroseus]